MAVVVKWLTQRIVAPSFVGSIPISRPIENKQEVIWLLFFIFPKWAADIAGSPTIRGLQSKRESMGYNSQLVNGPVSESQLYMEILFTEKIHTFTENVLQ